MAIIKTILFFILFISPVWSADSMSNAEYTIYEPHVIAFTENDMRPLRNLVHAIEREVAAVEKNSSTTEQHIQVALALAKFMAHRSDELLMQDDFFYKTTPLHYAASEGYLDAVKVIILCAGEHNTNKILQRIDNTGRTPLHGAGFHGHIEVVKFLLATAQKSGCGRMGLLIKMDINGDTVLHRAATTKTYYPLEPSTNGPLLRIEPFDLVIYLIEYAGKKLAGSYLMKKNHYGQTPRDVARAQCENEMADFLQKAEEAYGSDENNDRLLEFLSNYKK